MPIYYVDTVDGLDTNLGTSEGSGNAWKTIGKATTSVAAGDHVYIKASGNYNEAVTIGIAGTSTSTICYEGYTTTPGDNGRITLDGESTRATGIVTTLGSSPMYNVFRNMEIINHTSSGVNIPSADNILWQNCVFQNNGSHGCACDANLAWVRCSSLGNGGAGFYSTGGSTNRLLGCLAGNNTQHGYRGNSSTNTLIYKSVFYGLSASSSYPGIDSDGMCVGCTFDGEGGAATRAIDNATTTPCIVDNILYDCSVGLVNSASTIGVMPIVNNLFNSNTTDIGTVRSTAAGSLFAWNNQTGAPAFTDEAGDDYTLDAASPAVDNGIHPGAF